MEVWKALLFAGVIVAYVLSVYWVYLRGEKRRKRDAKNNNLLEGFD